VPLAVGNIARLEAILKGAGGAVGAGVGAFFSPIVGPIGPIIGWFLGEMLWPHVSDHVGVRIVDGEVVEPDLADHWADPDNRPDLAYILDTLFDLANDVANNGAHPRAVLVVGGDIHAGGILRITSAAPRHRANNVIWQFISSPISRLPADEDGWLRDIDLIDDFYLCSTTDGDFRAKWQCGPMAEYNFGTLAISRADPAHRVYGVTGVIRGREHEYRHDLVFNLEEGGLARSRWRLPSTMTLTRRRFEADNSRSLHTAGS
jgi:hypothetical protein